MILYWSRIGDALQNPFIAIIESLKNESNTTIHFLNNSNFINHTLVHTGQNYDKNLNEIFFEDLGINEPDFYLDAVKGSPKCS